MTDLIGVTINNFEIQEKLGGGGMGIVYRARHPILERDVAIKVMRADLANQEGFYARFEREAQTIARLEHPGIVGVNNFGQHEGITYLMMDFVQGSTLRALLRSSPFGLPLETAIRLTQLLAQALSYAHGKGVLHLDLKPDNILLPPARSPASAITQDYPYYPVISDFGLARLQIAPGVSIQTTQSIGTPHYMSPEQCQGKSLNEQSDIYSLGVTFYETLSGQRPFPISTLVQAVHYHCKVTPDPPSAHAPGIPPALDTLVLEMLAKNPAQRPSSAGKVARQLEDILASLTPPPGAEAPSAPGGVVIKPPERGAWPADRAPAVIEVTLRGEKVAVFSMQSESIIVGRQPTCDLYLTTGNKLISRRHCEIRWQDGAMQARDLRSTNKTFLADAELEPGVFSPWPAGAPLRLGNFVLVWAPVEDIPTGLGTQEVERVYESTVAPVIECEDGNPSSLKLGSAPVIIGRAPGCELLIADRAVSKRHCEVRWDGEAVRVQDLGSTNGTCLGEVNMESRQLYAWSPQEALRIGPYTIRVRFE